MKKIKISQEQHEQFKKLLLQTADYWISHLECMDIESPLWAAFKKDMKSFCECSAVIKTMPDSIYPNTFIGLVDYFQSGKHIVFGPRVDDVYYSYVLAIEVMNNRFCDEYYEKTKQIQNLIYAKQKAEVEKYFKLAISSLIGKDMSIYIVDDNSRLRDCMIVLYKASLKKFSMNIIADVEKKQFNTSMYSKAKKDMKIPCVYGDSFIQLLENSNNPGCYSLRFGEFVLGNDTMSVSLEKDDYLKEYSDEILNKLSLDIEEIMTTTLMKMLDGYSLPGLIDWGFFCLFFLIKRVKDR